MILLLIAGFASLFCEAYNLGPIVDKIRVAKCPSIEFLMANMSKRSLQT